MSAGNYDYDASSGRQEIDLGGIGAAIGRKKRLVIGATLGAAAAALVFCTLVKPRYMAESRIIVENQESYFTRSDPDSARGVDSPGFFDTEAVNSQIQLLTSRDLGRKAVQILGLKGNPEFDPSSGNPLAQLAILLGLSADPSAQTAEDRVLINFFDHLTVMSPTKTRVLQVEFSAHDPELAARGANAVADLYIELKMLAKRNDAHQAAESLKPQIIALEAQVAQADSKVEQFRAKNGLFEIDSTTKTAPKQQLGEIATKLADARSAQSEAQAKARGLRDLLRQGRLGDAGEISSNDLVRRIADQRVIVRSQLASESRTLLPGHPRIKELEAQLSDIETQLRAAVEKAARGLDNDSKVAGARVANLTALLEEQKSAVGVSTADESQLLELERNAKTLKDQLVSQAAKYQAALSRDNADSSPADARIISRAMAPSLPVFPKKLPVTIFAAIAALVLTIGGIAAREMMSESASGQPKRPPPPPREMGAEGRAAASRASAGSAGPAASAAGGIARASDDDGSPLLSRLKRAVADYAAPAVALDGETQKSAALQHSAAPDVWAPADSSNGRNAAPTSARGLVGRIAQAAAQGGVKVLIASAEDSEPSCASLKLSRALAREGRAVLVQIDDSDFYLRDALEHAASGAPEEGQPGLAQLLEGEASFAEAIYRDGATRLHIVQSGGAVQTDSDDLHMILDALQATYDFVLIACGSKAAATHLPAEAALTVIFAEDRRARDFLHDDFEAAGARAIALAGLDPQGEIVETAA